MAPNPRRIAARLDALYAQLPAMSCQGLCEDSCGPIPAGAAEQQRVERARGRPLAVEQHRALRGSTIEVCHECSMMDNGRCAVYDIRPMICRLWGLVEDMPCPYGCVPDGGLLPAEAGLAFLAEAYDIAGWPPGQRRFAREEIEQLFADPQARRFFIRHHRASVAGRRASIKPTAIDNATPLR